MSSAARLLLLAAAAGAVRANGADAAAELFLSHANDFMATFAMAVERSGTTCRASSLGLPKPPSARIKKREDRKALLRAYDQLNELRMSSTALSATSSDTANAGPAEIASASLALMQGLELFLHGKADGRPAPALLDEALAAQLCSLREICLKKPKGTVRDAHTALCEAFDATASAQQALVAAALAASRRGGVGRSDADDAAAMASMQEAVASQYEQQMAAQLASAQQRHDGEMSALQARPRLLL